MAIGSHSPLPLAVYTVLFTPSLVLLYSEVHRRNGLAMFPEERQPSLHHIWISRGSLHPSRDTPFREIETQLQQFAVNPRRSPGRILRDHTEDQGANLLADTLPPSNSSDS